jgi:DNA-binding MurR/RpiR family transcriptional regulator
MSYRKKIREARPRLTKSFAKLADYLLDSYIEASFMTATELALTLNLDAATVVRFSQSLGYNGYPQLLREIRSHVKHDFLVRPDLEQDPGSPQGILADAIGDLKIAMDQIQNSLNTDSLTSLVEQIGTVRRILVFAEGPAQTAAYNLVYFLEQGNFPIFIARSGLAGLARTIHTATDEDLLIAIDIAGEAPYIAPALREARGKGISTAAIVGSPSLASAHSAGLVLAARGNPDMGVEIVIIETIIFVLVKTLRLQYAERFAGAEHAISELSSLLQ